MIAEELPAMPFDRPGVVEIAPMYQVLQAKGPPVRIRTPTGDMAWLVTGYEQVKRLAADGRLGRSHPDPEHAPRFSCSAFGGAMGAYETEKDDHERLRRLLMRSFMVKRMNALRPRCQEIVDDLCTRMANAGPPADLRQALAYPLPLLMICELLGVPYEDRKPFQSWAEDAGHMYDQERVAAGFGNVVSYMSELVQRKREAPAEDVLSDVVTVDDPRARMDDGQVVLLAVGLLLGGHMTIVPRIELGTVLLLTHPDQLESLRHDRSLLIGAVEEILRMALPCQGVVPRYATSDMEIDGAAIAEGELVLLGFEPANWDPTAFTEPDRFDIRRRPNLHVAFGYGRYFCPGAGLARVELQTVFGTLFERFPTLRLEVPVGNLWTRPDGGLAELPVAW